MDLNIFMKYPDVLSVEQMRSALGVGRNAAYNLIKSKKIPYFRVGSSIRIPKQCLIDYIIGECYNSSLTNGQSVE